MITTCLHLSKAEFGQSGFLGYIAVTRSRINASVLLFCIKSKLNFFLMHFFIIIIIIISKPIMHRNSFDCTEHMYDVIPLCPLQILTNARQGGTPAPTTQCASTWREATTAGAPTGITAPATVSMTTRSSTAGRYGCWTATGARCAPAR